MENGYVNEIRDNKAFFILHNFEWIYPSENADALSVMAHTYGQAVKIILNSNLNLSDNLGGIIINHSINGYLRIYPHIRIPLISFDDSFRQILGEVFDGGIVQDGAISLHTTNILPLFNLNYEIDVFFTRRRRVIGCLLGDLGYRYVLPIRACMDHTVRINETLIFVVGRFQDYEQLCNKITNWIEVEGEPTANQYVTILKNECERKWGIM